MTMLPTKDQLFEEAMQVCDEEERSTEYMIQYMQDYADATFDEVIDYLKSVADKEQPHVD